MWKKWWIINHIFSWIQEPLHFWRERKHTNWFCNKPLSPVRVETETVGEISTEMNRIVRQEPSEQIVSFSSLNIYIQINYPVLELSYHYFSSTQVSIKKYVRSFREKMNEANFLITCFINQLKFWQNTTVFLQCIENLQLLIVACIEDRQEII